MVLIIEDGEDDDDINYDNIIIDKENITLESCKITDSKEKEDFINANFIENENEEEKDDEILERKSLSGILNICLLKYISIDINENIMNKIKSPLKEK